MNRAVSILLSAGLFLFLLFGQVASPRLRAGEIDGTGTLQVLAPIRHGNLTIFPVISPRMHDTSQFLTLDEGLRSGEVTISESGSMAPLLRPRQPSGWHGQHPTAGGEVNRLVLVNNSKRPLLLLAGEIVTGGKQDRIIAQDRLVPSASDPIDLSVFCVEPGRWVATSDKFDAPRAMVQPSVRAKAMGAKNQQQVWDEVGKTRMHIAANMPSPPAQQQVAQTSSYAAVVANRNVLEKIDAVAAPVEHDYQSVISRLREKNAVGVVVAVNGQLIWADVFASTKLLEKYWPKLVRSYAAESMIELSRPASMDISVKAAQAFLNGVEGGREVVESEPGLYRHTEISGEGFKVFELTSLLPGTDFDLHLAKMAQ
ncbi:MAG: hypothetical protein JO159_18270 [Acidobacteria bacterium]|nr:hypothetical protein [Acidobacteriota bacterium]